MASEREAEPSGAAPVVAVVAPAPLLTVTIEPAGDEADVHLHAGGQAFWIARLAQVLGTHVRLCGTFGGEAGLVAHRLIEAMGIDVRAIDAGSNGAYVHDRRSGERVVVAEMSGAALSRHEVDELYGAALVEGLEADVCVLGGPTAIDLLPPDTYRRLAGDLSANDAPVLADLSGDELTEAIEGGVALAKVSEDDLRGDGRLTGHGVDAIVEVIEDLAGDTATDVVVSRGEEPLVARIDGELWQAHGPRLEPIDDRGAGDSLTAGIAAGLAHGMSKRDALRLGVGAGALNVTRRGLATGTREEIERLAAHVELERLATAAGRRTT